MPDLAARAEDQPRLRRIKAEFWFTLEMNEYRDFLNDLQEIVNKNAILHRVLIFFRNLKLSQCQFQKDWHP